VTRTAERIQEFRTGSGRYAAPKRAYRQPPEQVATIKRQSDAVRTARAARDVWRARAEAAEAAVSRVQLTAEALAALAGVSEHAAFVFASKKILEAIRG
jgi:hypothetical protein